MTFKVLELKNEGMLITNGIFYIEINFYTTSFTLTHGITVKKGRDSAHVYCSLREAREILSRLLDKNKEKEMWLVLNLIQGLSYKVKHDRLANYLHNRSFTKPLKAVWLSMLYNHYGKNLRKKKRDIVRELIKLGSISLENPWARKILTIEKRIFWKRLLSNEWE